MEQVLVRDKMYEFLSQYIPPESAMDWTSMIAGEVEDNKESNLRQAKKSLHERFKEFEYRDIGTFIFEAQIELEKLNSAYQDVFDKKEDDFLPFLKDKHELERDLVHDGGIKGYRLHHLEFYERMCDGLRPGLHYFGAHANVGKTSMLCTMNWDVLISNKDVSTMFITIDDTRDKITNNLLACTSNRSQNIVDRKRNSVDEIAVENAYDKLIGWGANGRMTIVDSSSFDNDPEKLANIIYRARKKYKNLVVFVDGIANLTMKGTGEERQSNIAMMFKHLWKPTMSGLPPIPIILSHELKRIDGKRPKKGDLKGSSKYEYTADVVVCLSAEDEEAFNEKTNMVVYADVDKNKMGSGKGVVHTTFEPDKSKFSEKKPFGGSL